MYAFRKASTTSDEALLAPAVIPFLFPVVPSLAGTVKRWLAGGVNIQRLASQKNSLHEPNFLLRRWCKCA